MTKINFAHLRKNSNRSFKFKVIPEQQRKCKTN